MEIALIALTVTSLLLAASMAAVTARHVRDSRGRADALRQLALADELPASAPEPARGADHVVIRESRPTTAPVMFAAADEPPPPSRRWISLAGVAAVVLVVTSTVALLHDPVAAPAAASPTTDGAASASAAPGAPLALVALRHEINRAGTLTVVGVVRTSTAGQRLADVRTVVTAFDRQGQPLATRETPLDAGALGPNTASAFEARLTGVRGIARFDVAFRGADGAPIPHLRLR